ATGTRELQSEDWTMVPGALAANPERQRRVAACRYHRAEALAEGAPAGARGRRRSQSHEVTVPEQYFPRTANAVERRDQFCPADHRPDPWTGRRAVIRGLCA